MATRDPDQPVSGSSVLASIGELELTFKAVLAGCAMGALLVVGNLYMGLKTGWWETGHSTAAILGFVLLSALSRRGAGFSVGEHNVVVSTATSMGALPATAGLFGALPAISMFGRQYPVWLVVVWAAALGFVGVALGLLLQRRMLQDTQLPFPSGVAVAELISSMHASGRAAVARARALVATGIVSMFVVWFRDGRPTFIPQASFVSATFDGIAASTLKIGVSWSPLLLGAGALAGVRAGLSLVLGALVSWAVIAPRLVESGAVAESSYSALASWLAFPGVALVLGASSSSLLRGIRALPRAVGDLRAATEDLSALGLEGNQRRNIRLALAAAGLVVALGWLAFGVSPILIVLALALSVLLGGVCARAAGQTDIAPLGKVGRLTQLAAGAVVPGNAVANILAGAVVSGSSAQAVSVLYALKASARLGTSPRSQVRAQLAGVALGSVLSVPIYLLLVKAHGLGGAHLPIPSALEWKAVAEVVAGPKALPPYALLAAVVAFLAGLFLTFLSGTKLGRYLPMAPAVGIAFIAPAFYSATLCAGAILFALSRRLWPTSAEAYGAACAAGAITGESLAAVAVAALAALGVLSS